MSVFQGGTEYIESFKIAKCYRSIGSVDVVAAARSVLQMEHAPENKDIRIVRQIKNNLAPSDGEIRFSITAEEGFRWLECRIPTDPEAESEPPKFESKSEKAAYLIKKRLSDGDMRSREIYMRMSDEGISRRTAENTKKGQYLARPDAGADCVVCDPLSAHLGGCHGHGFSQPQQVQRL